MRRITEAALATPKGRKKDFCTEMPKGYDPTYVEAAMCAPSFRPCTGNALPWDAL